MAYLVYPGIQFPNHFNIFFYLHHTILVAVVTSAILLYNYGAMYNRVIHVIEKNLRFL